MQESTAEGKRKIEYLELLRIIASFFVIVNHTASGEFLAMQPDGRKWFFLVTYFFMSKTAVPVFLMISGVLLLRHVDEYRKNGARIIRIVLDIIIFSFIYYVRSWYVNGMSFDLIEFFKLIYQQKITNAYWYLYLYLGLLVMLPLLQRLASAMGRREYLYLIAISVVFLGVMPILIHYREGLLYNAGFSSVFLPTLAGLLFLGYFLENHVEIKWQYVLISVIVIVCCLVFLVSATYAEYQRMPENYLFFDDRTHLTITAMAASLFYLARCFGHVCRVRIFWKIVTWLGGCSFGIYLLSDFFLEVYAPLYQFQLLRHFHVITALLIYEGLIFLTGAAVTAVLRCIPAVKRLV